uniref:Putative integral membrane protein n=1 Tax=Streptomyces kanamyceticus TaxID=1967 RepID=E9KTE2_STRKN|nr:putative integral membrane protein [Streptomyces kanamyceticus]
MTSGTLFLRSRCRAGTSGAPVAPVAPVEWNADVSDVSWDGDGHEEPAS